MPIYEYRCKECHQVFEEWCKNFEETHAKPCPICRGNADRIVSNTSFVLKGGGWYVTDYGNRKESKPEAPSGTGESKAADAVQAAPAAPAAATPAPGASPA